MRGMSSVKENARNTSCWCSANFVDVVFYNKIKIVLHLNVIKTFLELLLYKTTNIHLSRPKTTVTLPLFPTVSISTKFPICQKHRIYIYIYTISSQITIHLKSLPVCGLHLNSHHHPSGIFPSAFGCSLPYIYRSLRV